MAAILSAIGDALHTAFLMFWEVLWPLVLGFALSGAVQAVVSHRAMARLLGDDSPRSLSLATLFGIASSSCSYAAVALARSIFLKGASFTAAMVFELASTDLVIELGVILIVLMGWPFAAAEFAGGIIIVVLWPSSSASPSHRVSWNWPAATPKRADKGGWRGTRRWK